MTKTFFHLNDRVPQNNHRDSYLICCQSKVLTFTDKKLNFVLLVGSHILSRFVPYQLPSMEIRNTNDILLLFLSYNIFAQYSHKASMEKTKFLQYFLLIFSSHHVLCENYSPKIVGGFNVTSFSGFRHQVSIRDASHESSRFGSGHLCGGSLIDYDTVRRRKIFKCFCGVDEESKFSSF